MAQCCCTTELIAALYIPDLVNIVQSYMSLKSDADIIADRLYTGSNALHISDCATRDGRNVCRDDLDAFYRMTILLKQGYRIPGYKILLFFTYTIGQSGGSGTVRMFNAECVYVPSGLLDPDPDSFAGWNIDRIFSDVSNRARQAAHQMIVNTLATYGCRHY